ncbi:DUF2147 domain-containing protein [Bradyrhizobium diazoefficiens]|uniref:DUF2147 domain-containing protein n=1 Tax=Bradyrhizobium diazoefficiens SEMIA 5080 TaxID=754504 RepID=A0A837CDC5_9BRAD|nr:DUF2147 domain-containing protein [Bradyrhizobium diazoefficiens]MBP1063122.1 hypothetical protein [Bradyrhizobium japonicum]APO51143.1 hypothetical protein BD122_12800 [Bradyrhizobium diazoefficiens]KGJ67035.1 hypothetical protein BJA5080_03655 [Bradyrhizobium diazoefficiens SEMIA 5080]KOY11458.1 hypothetical protein AF336_04735 [Bradyrhizobium diazoefficiens]MCD9298035.1 DUF2147 domain-containing protein [Bradyrhizobium diazoefficiens]
MTRLATSLGILIALLAVAPPAQAGSYSFSIGGHRFHVEAPRNCRSASCVSISSNRGFRPAEDVAMTPAAPGPPPVVQAPQPVYPATPARPPQAIAVAPSPALPPPVLAATTSQPVVLPPAPRPEAPRIEAMSPNPPRVELSRTGPPKPIALDPPRMEPPVVAPRPEIKPATTIAQRSDDESPGMPLGQWESDGAKGTVRIERCGSALCGYALTEASSRGESVLVNMKQKSHDVWTGSIYSRSTGNTYYARMTLKSPGKLYVEACALGHFWCSGNDWTRIEEPQERLATTSRQWGARS